jgi:hypothetical protein
VASRSRPESAAARLLGLRVPVSLEALMSPPRACFLLCRSLQQSGNAARKVLSKIWSRKRNQQSRDFWRMWLFCVVNQGRTLSVELVSYIKLVGIFLRLK